MEETKSVWEVGMTYKYIPHRPLPSGKAVNLSTKPHAVPKEMKWCNRTEQRTRILSVPTGTDGPNFIVTLFPTTLLFTFFSICSVLS